MCQSNSKALFFCGRDPAGPNWSVRHVNLAASRCDKAKGDDRCAGCAGCGRQSFRLHGDAM